MLYLTPPLSIDCICKPLIASEFRCIAPSTKLTQNVFSSFRMNGLDVLAEVATEFGQDSYASAERSVRKRNAHPYW